MIGATGVDDLEVPVRAGGETDRDGQVEAVHQEDGAEKAGRGDQPSQDRVRGEQCPRVLRGVYAACKIAVFVDHITGRLGGEQPPWHA